MQVEKIFKGKDEQDLWQQVEADMKKNDLLQYRVALEQASKRVILDIDIDPGGGFDSGFATTTFLCAINIKDDFRFAIHEQTFLDATGKFFGMQDVVIGYPEFDDQLIIKTNDAEKTKAVFKDKRSRETIQSLKGFTLDVVRHSKEDSEEKETLLELQITEGITEPKKLRSIYGAFLNVATRLDEL